MNLTADLPARLRAARERRGLSVPQAADDLRVDPRIIEALESGEFANLGAPVYAKGHLRKYAALLGIPNADVAEMIGQLDAPVPEQVNPEMAIRIAAGARFGGRSSKRPVVGVALLAMLVGGVLWWKPWRLRLGERSIPAVPQAIAPTSAQGPRADASPPRVDAPPAQATGDAVHPPRTPAAGAVPVPGSATRVAPAGTPVAGGELALQFTFTADCWVDVRDAQGRPIFQAVARAGSSRTLSGRAPFTVILGHAAGVALRIGDRPVEIPPTLVSGNVARFVIGADGAIGAFSTGSPQPPP